MSAKKPTQQTSPSQVDELLALNGQKDPESQEVEEQPDEVSNEDFLTEVTRVKDPEKEEIQQPKAKEFSDDVTIADEVEDFYQKEVKKVLPKYDYLKINSRFLDSDNVGQVFKKNTATGKYDVIIQKIKDKYETLLSLGYEIHNQTFLETDYILFTFILPTNDKATSK